MYYNRAKKQQNYQYIDKIIEILPKQFYFAVITTKVHRQLLNTKSTIYLSIDKELVYRNFHKDFGPLNISCLYKYCNKINRYLKNSKGKKIIVHYTTQQLESKTNAAFLIGAYLIIYLKQQPKEIYQLLQPLEPFREFVDALHSTSTITVSLLDCFEAIAKVRTFNFFNFTDFNIDEYDVYDKFENGNLNWIVPRKFLAFIGPVDKDTPPNCTHKPKFYLKYFLRNNIQTVIRLNNNLYNSTIFTNAGIEHFDLFFEDGTVPSEDIMTRFLRISETAPAAIAVHCKAGLGRTGTLIACYLIKHYHLTAKEAISWLRICRAGCVTGLQQIWLEEMEDSLWKIGDVYRLRHYGDCNRIPKHKYGIYSKQWPIDRQNILNNIRRNKINLNLNLPL